MNFSSLREFFYKLANRCYLLILLPLGVFIYIYHQLETKKINALIKDEDQIDAIMIGLLLLAVINLTTVHWLSRKRLKRYALEVGLGHKLDRYEEVVLLRMKACSASSLLVGVGLLLTANPAFGFSFLLILFWSVFQWPTSKRACRDLRLRGDEYEMVLFKKDKF